MSNLTRGHIDREQLEQIFEERLASLTAGVEQAVTESLADARRQLAGKLNQAVRRLRRVENDKQWSDTLVESAQGFCERSALFTIASGRLQVEASWNVANAAPAADVLLQTAPAFASAVETKDTVVAMRTKGEMSQAIASWLGEAASRKFYLYPIVVRERVAALLYADADARNIESNALELLATVAGAVRKPADVQPSAQRFARAQVAGMMLHQSENVKKGRAARNLYASLKTEIDSARQSFRRDFLSEPGSMVDYLHLELVRTLANEDAELLGPEYPGPLL